MGFEQLQLIKYKQKLLCRHLLLAAIVRTTSSNVAVAPPSRRPSAAAFCSSDILAHTVFHQIVF
jgi:hypothetical protein